MQSARRIRLETLIATAVLIMCTGRGVSAARLLKASIEHDGVRVFEAQVADDGIPDLQSVTVWRYLDGQRFTPIEGDLTMDRDAPDDVVLEGKVAVRIQHGSGPGHRVETDRLTLRHHSDDGGGWYLPPGWVAAHDPPGDLAAESRRIARQRRLEFWRIPTTLAMMAAAGFGCLMALISLVARSLRLDTGRLWRAATIALCTVSLVCSVAAFGAGSELFGGRVWPIPIAAALGLAAAVLASLTHSTS